jgi:hypothetical protein
MNPRDERVLTLDRNPDELFKAWKKAGKVPERYNSFAEMEAEFNSLLKQGFTEKAAREAMGVTYRNVDGQNLLQRNVASDGSTRGLNKRAIRTDFNIGAENHLRNRGGDQAVNNRLSEIRTDWNKLSKYEAQQLGVETGKQFHRGHVVAGLEGGSLGNENMYPEHGMRNVLHGKEPRVPLSVIDELAIPRDDLATIYERQLQAEGLGMPRVNNALWVAADEQMVDPTGRDTYMRNNEAGRSPESMLATQQRLNELEAQGISRQTIENWSRNQSGTLSQGNAVQQSGPVRQVVPPRVKTVNVAEPGNTRTRPRAIPTGASPSIGPKSSTPVVVKPPTNGQVAKAAATAKPIPPPTVKPVPRTRPVGTQATLGGKPVVWNGKSWAPVLPNRLAQPTKPKPITRTSKTSASATSPALVKEAMSQQERLRNAGAHPILIHPGMSLPSQSLIQGI